MLDPTAPYLTTPEVIDREREAEQLAAILAVVYLLMLRRTHTLVLEALALDPLQFRINRADVAYALQVAAARATLITGSTVRALDGLVAEARTLGLTQAEMVAALDGLYRETFAGRPALQAANEAHHALLVEVQDRYRGSGVISEQEIRDGDYDAACRARNGTRVPITTPVLQLHPNCRVVTRPVRAVP